MTDNRYALRPEAGPVPLDLLNRSQRDALGAIIAALSEAVTKAASPNEPCEAAAVDRAIETDRVSRMFFVSGEPGSGKSSLCSTLRQVTGRPNGSKDSRHRAIRAEYSKLWDISDLDGTTRWLEPLDLEVAVEDEENLLAAVLVRIFEAIDEATDRSSLSASKDCRDAMAQLEELANDIGIAWDGNLKARGGALDPDSYSQETMRAQRTRLKINRRLRIALDTLLKNRCYGFCREELFVLPIDDFYLKPKASLELLRLLRMISVPRLFFLIMGDIKTVEALFLEKALADWTAVAGPEVFATLRERTTQDVLPRAREMRARYLRKLIPEGQRAIINWTEWDQALRFKPPRATADSSCGDSLCKLLSDIRWNDRPDERDRNLLDYLVSPLLDGDTLCETTGDLALPDPENRKRNMLNKFREAYSGLQILDATPRELLDLWMRLPKAGSSKEACGKRESSSGDREHERHLRALVESALPAIEEQDFLTEEDQEILRFAFPGSDRDDLQLGTHKLRVTQKFSPWRRSPHGDVLVREHLDWRLRIRDPECKEGRPRGRKEKRHLPPRKAAWVILLHDLVWDWKQESVLDNLVRTLFGEIRDSVSRTGPKQDWSTRHPGWAWYEDGGQWRHFPLPGIDTFRQLDRFLAIWGRRPSTLGRERVGPPLEPKAAVQKWAMAAWIAVEGSEDSYEKYVKALDDSKDEDDNARWYEKRAVLRDEIQDTDNSTEQGSFGNFRNTLFKGHPGLLDWALGGQK